jgi:quinol monooxygenase YgiN
MVKRMLSLGCLFLFLAAGSFAQDMSKETVKQEMKKVPAKSGTVTVIITHEVKEYASWRKVYDADETNRRAAGMKVWGVYADMENPNLITIIGTFPSAAAVEGFVASPKLKEAMDKGGVISKPDVKVLTAMAK